jgi:hypothetical protein
LQKLSPEIEERYGKYIKKWTGDMSIFEDANKIIDKYFNVDEFIPKKKPKDDRKSLFAFIRREK